MDIGAMCQTFAAAAGGCLTVLKAYRVYEARKRRKDLRELELDKLLTADDFRNAVVKLVVHNRSRLREIMQLRDDVDTLQFAFRGLLQKEAAVGRLQENLMQKEVAITTLQDDLEAVRDRLDRAAIR